MKIKNLAQLKRVVQEKKEFVIKEHRIKEWIGQKRTPNIIQSNGFYSIVTGQPAHEVSLANAGKGSWIEYGKASQWEFQDGLCSMYLPEKEHLPENRIWTITFDALEDNKKRWLYCSIICNAYYDGKLLLPEHIKTFPEAVAYAKEHLDEIPVGTLEYISDSDVLDEDNCELETIEPEELEGGNIEGNCVEENCVEENNGETLRKHWWEIIEGIKECETRFAEQRKKKEAEQLATYMDLFYPKDVVEEILSDREGEVVEMAEEKTLFPDEYYYFIGTQEHFYSFRRVTEKDIQWVLDEISRLGFLPPNISEGEVYWLSEEYSRASGKSRYYYPLKLWPWRNLMTIEKLDSWYADTDLDWMEYAEEYQRSISGILNGRIILNPQKLALEEKLSEWVECLTESMRADYRKAFEEIKEGKIPIIRECDYVAY